MAVGSRHTTKYPGVFYRVGQRIGISNTTEHIFYIVFKQDGKTKEEKVGRQYADNMTAAKAARIRADRIEGRRLSRQESRNRQKAMEQAESERKNIRYIWELYQIAQPDRNWASDRTNYNRYLATSFADKLPDEIVTQDIDRLAQSMRSAQKSPQTIKHVLALLRRLINFGVRKGLCLAINPARLYFEMPTADNEKTENLNASQLTRYLQALDNEPDQCAVGFLRLALVTGMRKGALMNLRWDDVDFDSGFITLRGNVAKKGKTERIPLNQSAREVLIALYSSKTSEYIFPGKDGGPRKEFRRIAQRVKEKAGLPADFRPLHGLRHAYASLLASSGEVDLYTLQKLLTHSNHAMTQRYAHLTDEAMHRAAKVLDTMFGASEKHGDGNNEK